MAEFQRRLDAHESYLIAKSLVKLWLDEFLIDYAKDGWKAVSKWFDVPPRSST